MRRIAIVLSIGLIAALAYAWNGLRAVEAKRSIEDAVLEDGGRSLVRGPAPTVGPDPFGDAAPRGARDILLELRWPEGRPEAQSGGSVLLSLRGNRALFLRPERERGLWRRRVLDRALTAQLDAAMRGLVLGQDLELFRAAPGGPERRRVGLAEAEALVARFAGEADPYWPAELHIDLERGAAPESEALPFPSRFRFADLEGIAAAPTPSQRGLARFRTAGPAAQRFARALQVGASVGPDQDGERFLVRSFELVLP